MSYLRKCVTIEIIEDEQNEQDWQKSGVDLISGTMLEPLTFLTKFLWIMS